MISELPYVSGRASLTVSFTNGDTKLRSISVVRCPDFDILYFWGPEDLYLLELTLSKGWEDILSYALDKELEKEHKDYNKVIPIRETTEA